MCVGVKKTRKRKKIKNIISTKKKKKGNKRK